MLKWGLTYIWEPQNRRPYTIIPAIATSKTDTNVSVNHKCRVACPTAIAFEMRMMELGFIVGLRLPMVVRRMQL